MAKFTAGHLKGELANPTVAYEALLPSPAQIEPHRGFNYSHLPWSTFGSSGATSALPEELSLGEFGTMHQPCPHRFPGFLEPQQLILQQTLDVCKAD